jgi:AraC-like DNA-binding protein
MRSETSTPNTIVDSNIRLKTQALHYASHKDATRAVPLIESYILQTGDFSILNDHLFEQIQNSSEYKELSGRFDIQIIPIALFYIYAGLLGFSIFFIIVIRKTDDTLSHWLMGLFVLFHSLFILHLSLYVINAQMHFPHALFISTTFSFLYGPLLYFYCKRVILSYQFKWYDGLHLIPSLLLLKYIIPYYNMSKLDKLQLLYQQEDYLLPGANWIILGKILSLVVYTVLLLRLYTNERSKYSKDKNIRIWHRNMISIFAIYTLSCFLYAAVISNYFNFPWLLHLQIIIMVSLVFYIAYIVYTRPEIFDGTVKIVDPVRLYKYKKSGLSPSLSKELRDRLLYLFNEEHIYRKNDLSLNELSKLLQTSRHHTSQVINEHFGLNFFELINKYRIEEAIKILTYNTNSDLNIIDIAYDVGFNNKVTFNKTFKRYYHQTPSQYITSLQR